jgi:hypothetical protein
MSKQERDDEFWAMADEFIQLANDKCDTTRNGKVSTTMLFAAARFNAFMFASMAKDLDEFKQQRDLAIEYFSDQYKQAFIENINDYEKNYADYVGKPKR